jgi:hypothetical protein
MRIEIEDNAYVCVMPQRGSSFVIEYTLNHAGSRLIPFLLETGDSVVRAAFREGGTLLAFIEDVFVENAGLTEIRRGWKVHTPGEWGFSVRLSFDFSDKPEIFVPAVMYRGNEMGKGAFPRGGRVWSFLESRTPLPSCTLLYSGSRSFVSCIDPASEERFLSAASAKTEGKNGTVNFRIPGSEWPASYTGKHTLSASPLTRDRAYLAVPADRLPFTLERTIFCMGIPSDGSSCFTSYRVFLESLPPRTAARDPAPEMGWSGYSVYKLRHLLSLIEPGEKAIDESKLDLRAGADTAYLVMGRNNGSLQKVYNYTAGSFLVKSLEGALILAREDERNMTADIEGLLRGLASRMGRDSRISLADIAESIGRFFLAGERTPGVHQDCYDIEKRIWGGYLGISEDDDYRNLVNARCNGEVMRSYVHLYEELRKKGREIPEFIELPKRVAAFYLKHQMTGEERGSFGRWWSKEGEPVSTAGTNGAHIVPFLIAIAPYMENREQVRKALSDAGTFYRSLTERDEFFGDTLDSSSCDKEAGCILLAMFLDLYEFDGDRTWLAAATKAADFILTWIWQYDCLFPSGSLLESRSFTTTGMTSVSVAHHHLDFYGMAIAYDFFRLWSHTEIRIYRDQGLLMMRACRQLIATEKDPLGRGSEDIGWQPEQINHTEWDYFDRAEHRTGHFDIDIAWVTVLGLGAFQRIERRFPEALSDS